MQFFPASHFFKAISAAYHVHSTVSGAEIPQSMVRKSVHFCSIMCDFRRSLCGSARSCAEIPQGPIRKLASIWSFPEFKFFQSSSFVQSSILSKVQVCSKFSFFKVQVCHSSSFSKVQVFPKFNFFQSLSFSKVQVC